MKKTKNNKMLMHAFILVTILATAKSAEAEITMEAAFQGHCGHTSPCEQLCYEIHDGMYECDCIEGYELNKNGYSCQVINSTSSSDGHSKSDEDVLYQKGASFSAKLANNNNSNNNNNNINTNNERDNQLTSGAGGSSSASSSIEDNDEEADSFFVDDLTRIAQRENVNLNDYYISAESIAFDSNNNNNYEDQDDLTNTSQDVPEFKAKAAATTASDQLRSSNANAAKNKPSSKFLLYNSRAKATPTVVPTTTTSATVTPLEADSSNSANIEDDYYSKQDMSIYDDVNNNQLNLRPLSQQRTYQQAQSLRNSASKPMSISRDNQKRVDQHALMDAATAAIPTKNNNNNNDMISVNTINISNNLSATGAISDLCNLDCGTEGQCDNSEGSKRCLCPFGKTSNGCMEDTKIRIPKFSKKSWLAFPALRGAYKHVQIRVEFRPESFDGIILLSGERDDLTGDFMALLLNKGFVEFWFDCGSGVGSVRSRETILLNEWNSVIIYRHRWDAWLVLNHGTKVQGRSNGLFSRITFREPVFLGGTGNITGLAKRLPVFNGFTGCIRRFLANEHEYKFEEHPLGDVTKGFDIQDCVTDKCFKYPCQHGGKCLPSDQGALCLCPIGFVGDLCEIRMDLQVPAFNGSSYLRYAPLGDNALIWLELKVILKTEQPDGLILYSGPEKHGDFIALSLSGGFVEFVFDLGSGPAVIRSEYPLSLGQWHAIKISRTARLAVLKVDQWPEVMTISSNGFWHLSLPDNLFLGGVNHIDKLPLDLKSKPFFVGCIQKIDINGHGLAIVSEALGGTNVGNCPHACVARPCGPLAECVPQMESYECRCSAYNTQCNKAAEVPLEELQRDKVKKNRGKSIESKHANAPHSMTGAAAMTAAAKAKKLKAHKLMKVHGKEHARYLHKIALSAATTTTTIATTATTTTTTTSALPTTQIGVGEEEKEEEEVEEGEDDIEDDIIFREVHGMHRKYGHGGSNGKSNNNNNNNAKIQRNADNKAKAIQTDAGEHLPRKHQEKSQHQHPIASELKLKFDPYHKHQPEAALKSERKLSHLPTHYESFQTNPDSDILTFDASIELDEILPASDTQLDASKDYNDNNDSDAAESESADDDNAAEQYDAHDRMNDETKSEPFLMDETLFDGSDSAEDSHRKQLAQDMQRIMANTQHVERRTTSKRPKLPPPPPPPEPQAKVTTDEYSYDYSDEHNDYAASKEQTKRAEDEDDNDVGEDADDDDVLLEPVQHAISTTQQQAAFEQRLTTPQTHTDWSLLTKFELSADHQSHFMGVRKNFGACFAGEDSYFHYNDAETMSQIISYNIDLNLRIKTHSHNGVILWTGRQGTTDEDDDFLALGIENGYLHFRYDLGSGEVDIKFNATKVSDGLWHRVRAIRDSQDGYLEVDGRKTPTFSSPGKLRQLNTDTGLYVGGMPDVSYFTRRKYKSGIIGCISEIVLAGELKLNFDPNTLGTAHNVETGIL